MICSQIDNMRNKKHGPVIYIDPKTGLSKCSPDKCKNKLVEYSEFKETNYKWVGGPVFHLYYYSISSDCGTRAITSLNKKKTDQSYKIATENQGVDPQVREFVNVNR